MNDGHAAGDGHDGAGSRLQGPHGWLLGAAGRGAPLGAVRRLREQRERLRASGHRGFEVRVRPHRSPIPTLPRRRLLFRPWAAHWSPYGRSTQRWRHSAVALRPTSDARNRRVPADTLRDAVQSAYSHTPRVACQPRTAADGGHTMNGPRPQALFQSSLHFDGTRIRFLRSSANPLFESAARVFEGRTIGVVLSGGGSDGTDGVQGVKQHGGVVIAQDQTTAQLSFAKMSRDAADASQADGVTKRILPKRRGTPTRTVAPRRHVAGRQQSSRRSTMPVRLHVCSDDAIRQLPGRRPRVLRLAPERVVSSGRSSLRRGVFAPRDSR
jgi:CheB methylesterase